MDNKNENEELWWRVDVKHYSIGDEDGYHVGTSTELQVQSYKVLKHTPKGVRLDLGFEGTRIVLYDTKKAFARPTKTAALVDAIHRKKRHIRILRARLKEAENDLRVLERAEI